MKEITHVVRAADNIFSVFYLSPQNDSEKRLEIKSVFKVTGHLVIFGQSPKDQRFRVATGGLPSITSTPNPSSPN